MMLGAGSCDAIDNDPDVLAVARENAALNGLAVTVDGRDVSDVEGLFGVVVANIRAAILIGMAEHLRARTSGLLLLSGVLGSEEAEVRAAFEAIGMHHEQTSRSDSDGDDCWVAMVMRP